MGERTLLEIATNKKHTEIKRLLSDYMAEAKATLIKTVGLYADLLLSVILILEKPRDVNTGLPDVKSTGSPPLPSIPDRLLRSVRKGKRIRDIPWTLLLTMNIYNPLMQLLDPDLPWTPSRYTNWAVITQTTLIRTAVALILTEGAAVKPTPLKYTAWPLFTWS